MPVILFFFLTKLTFEDILINLRGFFELFFAKFGSSILNIGDKSIDTLNRIIYKEKYAERKKKKKYSSVGKHAVISRIEFDDGRARYRKAPSPLLFPAAVIRSALKNENSCTPTLSLSDYF